MRWGLVLFAVLGVTAAPARAAGDGPTYSADQARAFHAEWSLQKWDKGGALTRYTFLNMPEFFTHAVIPRSGPVAPLESTPRADIANFVAHTEAGDMTLDAYARTELVDAVLVIHKGRVVYEHYSQMAAGDKHLFMSVSKAYAATLIAILEDRGLIDNAAAIDSYLPELKGSGWQGVSVRDILDMASGIGCLETDDGAYTDPGTCYYQYEASLGWLPRTSATTAATRPYIASLKQARTPGEAFEYTSINTFVLSWLAEAVTGKNYATLLAEEIWSKIGAQGDAMIPVSRTGSAISHGGIYATLRDMARFGLLFTPSAGTIASEPVISADYLAKIQTGGRRAIFDTGPSGPGMTRGLAGEHPRHNSYQWDFVMEDGDFYKGGFGGQGLYVAPRHDLVVAFFGTLDSEGNQNQMQYVARQLSKSDLFAR